MVSSLSISNSLAKDKIASNDRNLLVNGSTGVEIPADALTGVSPQCLHNKLSMRQQVINEEGLICGNFIRMFFVHWAVVIPKTLQKSNK